MKNPDSLGKSEDVEVSSLACEICIEPMTLNKKFENKKRCVHPFCVDCIAKYIEVKVEDREPNVPCPALNCEKLLDPLSCHQILPSTGLFEKWCDLLCESTVLRLENAYCPFPTCSTLILNECQENITRSECPNCKKLVCFQCKLPWHAGFGCEETGEMTEENDFLFGELVERNKWRRCPGCKYHVERNEGCQNIKCRCGVLFCYTCGKVKNACECNRRNIMVEGNMENRVVRTNVANLRGSGEVRTEEERTDRTELLHVEKQRAEIAFFRISLRILPLFGGKRATRGSAAPSLPLTPPVVVVVVVVGLILVTGTIFEVWVGAAIV
ncbi:probable E3 ubiquitin-protein ligase RNF217 [Telopea speciosissima]|uniref:probable E3 ubiquitin-protein ligase RNF217 n=1 Tax=Telopea speciosissima TaxID=54955 RepID=UPI001CC7B7E4|nr:probable E3 ubiquitin-protein ligase RNF217 [Telopea speciosissima]